MANEAVKLTPIKGSMTVNEMYQRIESVKTDRYELLQFKHLKAEELERIGQKKIEVLRVLVEKMSDFSVTDFVLIEYPNSIPITS